MAAIEAMTTLGLGLAGGALLALWHFGGLWITLRLLPRLSRPRQAYALSCLTRFSLTLAGFYGLLQLGPPIFMVALATFTLARLLMAGLARQKKHPTASPGFCHTKPPPSQILAPHASGRNRGGPRETISPGRRRHS